MAQTIDKLVGICCVLFSLAVFLYFSAWTFLEPFADKDSLLKSIFPHRAFLFILPTTGALLLTGALLGFIAVQTRPKQNPKPKAA